MNENKNFNDFLDKYYLFFNEDFPLMQAGGMNEAIKHIKECLKKQAKAQKLYPNIYGAVKGRNV